MAQQRQPLTPSAVDVSAGTPAEVSTRESLSASEVKRERHSLGFACGRDDTGDCVSFASLPPSPKTDLRDQNSPRKSLSPDSIMNNETRCHGGGGSKETACVEDSDCLLQLTKSNSVVARVSMFAQLEEDMKRAAKEANSRKFPKRSNRSVARREDLAQSGNRFATQPVTMGEVQEAVRSTISRDTGSTLTGTSNN